MKARDYEIVEERLNINVNAFRYQNKVFPLYVSKKSNEQMLNVLLISNEEKYPYVLIKNFNKLMYSQMKPFKIYADTECLLKRIDIKEGKYTKLYQEHTPNSICAKLVCIDNRFTLPTIIFEGNICINKFIKWIFEQNFVIK